MNHPLHFGTTGWSYDDWKGPFYPAGITSIEMLTHYSAQFDCVEVDSTFYRIPTEKMVRGWAERTPEEFRFSLKTPREITHDAVLVDCDDVMERFLERLEPLGGKLTVVVLQFQYFKRDVFAGAGPFLERLDAFLEQFAGRAPLAVEIRNKTWLSVNYFELLKRHRVAPVLVEHAWMPPINRVVERHDIFTSEFAYVRLIGDRYGIEKITKSWGETVVDRGADLQRVARVIAEIADKTRVYTFVNNHYAGHAPDTLRQLRADVEALP